MSDPQRTHEATPKRIREFRKRGEIALSREVVSAAALAAGAMVLVSSAGVGASALVRLCQESARAADGAPALALPATAVKSFLAATGPVMIAATIAALIAIAAQLGWPPAFKGLHVDLKRLSPLANLREIFGMRAIARRGLLTAAKLAALGVIVTIAVRHGLVAHPLEAGPLAAHASHVIGRALWFVIAAIGLLAALDYVLARRKLAARMRMTPDEVKREHKEQEGDPVIRGRRRQRMKELAKRRMAIAVAKSDVVVVNPTHYAVALRYDEDTDRAPVVVAKGVDEAAEKIREVARKHGVPVVSRPPLARALYKAVKEGRAIPSNLYRAVAEVLAYVYRVRRGGAS